MIEENRIEIVRTLEDVFASRGKKLNYRLTDKLIYNLQRIQQHKNTIPVYNKEYIEVFRYINGDIDLSLVLNAKTMIYGLKTADYVVEGLSFIDSLKTEDIEELLLKRTLELEVTTPELIINWIEDQLKHLRLEAYIKELANIRYSDLDSDGIEDKNDLQPLNHKIRFSEDFYER